MATEPITRGEFEQRLVLLREDVRLETRATIETARAEDRGILAEIVAGIQKNIAEALQDKQEIANQFGSFARKLDAVVTTHETELDIIHDRAVAAERESSMASAGYKLLKDALDDKFEAIDAASNRRWSEVQKTLQSQGVVIQRVEGYEKAAKWGVRALFSLPVLRWGQNLLKLLLGALGIVIVAVLAAALVIPFIS